MAENDDLDILGPLGAGPEDKKLQDPAHGHAEERDEHGRGFWHRNGTDAKSPFSSARSKICLPHAYGGGWSFKRILDPGESAKRKVQAAGDVQVPLRPALRNRERQVPGHVRPDPRHLTGR